ncbi:unnamed protein product [Symbiodinium natans]|uniref:Reverse transcriptase domain-containing protein n=1 Tax=Symbiodinium natans TaxID=878477 RepID=A0A812JXQ3_9DINO|nr:unnamed protein product [Symbiodinium natans]
MSARAPAPWQTAEVRASVKLLWQARDALRKCQASTGLASLFTMWRHAASFAKCSRECKRVGRQARRQRLLACIQEAEQAKQRGDLRGLYQVVKRLAPKQAYRRVQLRDSTGKMLNDDESVQALLVYSRATFCKEPTSNLTEPLQAPLQISMEELTEALGQLKPNKAVPPHSAPITAYQANKSLVLPAILQYLQQAWQPGLEPLLDKSWTSGWLVWIPKPGKSPSRPENLRPLALMTTEAKLIATVLKQKLTPYVVKFLLDTPQFAYVPNRNIYHSISKVLAHCRQVRERLKAFTENLHRRHSGVCPTKQGENYGALQITLDLSKAFDSLRWGHVQRALQAADVPQPLCAAVLSLLSHTTYHLHSGEAITSLRITNGIRQGCPLSPLLWSLASGRIWQILKQHMTEQATQGITLYADDHHLGLTFHDVPTFKQAIKQAGILLEVLDTAGLSVNAQKSVALLEVRGKALKKAVKDYVAKTAQGRCFVLPHPYSPQLPPTRIPLQTTATYLGIVIAYHNFEDATLKRNIRKAQGRYQQLRKILNGHHNLTQTTRLRLWRACIEPIFYYALHTTGITKQGSHLLYTALIKQLRAIGASPVHITHESSTDLLARLGVQWFHDTMQERGNNLLQKLCLAPPEDGILQDPHIQASLQASLNTFMELNSFSPPEPEWIAGPAGFRAHWRRIHEDIWSYSLSLCTCPVMQAMEYDHSPYVDGLEDTWGDHFRPTQQILQGSFQTPGPKRRRGPEEFPLTPPHPLGQRGGYGMGQLRAQPHPTDSLTAINLMTAKLSLQQEDSLQMTRADRGFVLHLGGTAGSSILDDLIQKSHQWHAAHQPGRPTNLNGTAPSAEASASTNRSEMQTPLRSLLMRCLVKELQDRLQTFTQTKDLQTKAQDTGLYKEGQWTMLRWDPDLQKMVPDQFRAKVTTEQTLLLLQGLHECLEDPTLVLRFHSLRKWEIVQKQRKTVMLLEVSLRKSLVHSHLLGLCGHPALTMIDAALKPEGLRRSPMAQRLSKMVAQYEQEMGLMDRRCVTLASLWTSRAHVTPQQQPLWEFYAFLAPQLLATLCEGDWQARRHALPHAEVTDLGSTVQPVSLYDLLNTECVQMPCYTRSDCTTELVSYELTACVLHVGDTPRAGHYTTLLRVGQGEWQLHDDARDIIICTQQRASQLAGEQGYVILLRKVSPIFEMFDNAFVFLFLAELVFRMFVEWNTFLKEIAFWFDFFLVAAGLVDMYIIMPLASNGGLSGDHKNIVMLRLVRALKALRAIRMVRTLRLFTGLRLLVKACQCFLPSLGWSMVLLGVFMTMGALVLGTLLQDFIMDPSMDLVDRQWVWMHYGTAYRALYTLYEITFAGNWPTNVRPVLDRVSHGFVIFFVTYITIIVFAVIRVISAIFLKDTLDAANNDAEHLVVERLRKKAEYVEKLENVFHAMDDSGDGMITEERLTFILANPVAKAYFATLDVDVYESAALFHLLDNGDGEVTMDEFIEGIMRCKGQARAMDQVAMRADLKALDFKLSKVVRLLKSSGLISKTAPNQEKERRRPAKVPKVLRESPALGESA